MGIFSKNDSIEYKKLDEYECFLENLLSLDEYISRKNYISQKDDLSGNGYSYFMVVLKEAFKEDEAYNLADTLEIIWNLQEVRLLYEYQWYFTEQKEN